MKTVLLTGINGFLGSFVARQLTNSYHVVGLKRSSSNIFRIKDISDNIILYNVDQTSLQSIFSKHSISIIIHTATNYGQKSSMEDIKLSNVEYPLQLLKLGSSNGVEAFVNTDTFYTANYGILQNYSISKGMFLEEAKQYYDQIKFVNLQVGIIFGPSDHRDKFTTVMIRQMLKNKTRIDLTKGEQKRNFLYIEEAARIYETVANKIDRIKNGFHDYVIGSGDVISIRDYLDLMHQVIGSTSKLEFGVLEYRENEIMNPAGNIYDILALGWKASLSLEQGLRRTIDYEIEQLSNE